KSRPLEKIYPFIFMDAIHYKVKDEGKVINKASYVVIGVNIEGMKEILGIWIGESESSKFWLGVLNDLRNRGIEEVLLFCVDGLTGIKEAIQAVYPSADIQRCIIHQLRNSFKYVSYKHLKEFSKDFKNVYQAINEEQALKEFEEIKKKWEKQYPQAIKSWETNWDILSSFYKFPQEVRKIIYTTNIIEGVHRQFRKVTKSKSVFPSDEALEKMLYLAAKNVSKKWTQRYRNWDMILNQLMILYPEQLGKYIK
ncbi:IS256 family transposase, partial [Caldicellulosiruptoraceae bacterium PP1]